MSMRMSATSLCLCLSLMTIGSACPLDEFMSGSAWDSLRADQQSAFKWFRDYFCPPADIEEPPKSDDNPPVTTSEFPCQGGPDAWKMTFSDEFDGDLSKWNLYNSPGHAGNGQRRPSAFSVKDGQVVITATEKNGVTTSGGMSAKHTQTFGCYWSKVRTTDDPSGSMSAVLITWPTGYREGHKWENDYYETLERKHPKPLMAFMHSRLNRDGEGCNNQAWMKFDVDARKTHEVAMQWEPDVIRVYVKCEGCDKWQVQETRDKCYIPHAGVEMRQTVQLDKKNGNRLVQPVEMVVDYIRIYEKVGGY